MSRIDHTFIDLTISVCGVTRDVSARVEYIHSPAFAATVERGSGVHTQAAERENAEILTVKIANSAPSSKGNPTMFDITHFLTAAQLDAITDEILED